MDAVIELLDDVPPQKVSIRMIAEKVGVSHMVFYTYFEDRDEIMRALIERQQKRNDVHFEGLLEKAKDRPVIEVLKQVLMDYSVTAHDHPKIYSMFWLTPKDGSKTNHEHDAFRHLEPSLHNIADLLDLGMEKGEFVRRDSRLAAIAVMGIMNAPLMLHRCGRKPSEFSCDQMLHETLTAVFAYLTTKSI